MTQPLIYLIAGEPSGDLLGGRLMASLNRIAPEPLRFAGIGGDTMKAEGLRSLFPMAELSVMGLVEVLSHLPNLIRRIGQTVEDILQLKPDVVVTIDAPDFSFRVASKVAARDPSIKLVHYVAPTVWAWRPGRAPKIAAFLDHLLALLPFEPPYFEREGLACSFVGHSAVSERRKGDAESFRAAQSLTPQQKVVLLLPGSRNGELTRLMPLCLQVARALASRQPDLFFVFPTVPHVAGLLREYLVDFNLPHAVIEDTAEKADAFAAAYTALAASGTVALELGLAGIPSVICYRLNVLTAFLVKRSARVQYVSLPNLILNQPIMPEFLQERATADLIVPALEPLLNETSERQRQQSALATLPALLAPDGVEPSLAAAQVLLNVLTGAAVVRAADHAVPPSAAHRHGHA